MPGAPDLREIADEMTAAVSSIQAERPHVVWIREMLDKPSVIELYSHAAVFRFPSIYEPLPPRSGRARQLFVDLDSGGTSALLTEFRQVVH